MFSPAEGEMTKVIVYVDGGNLYHRVKHAGYNRLLWLDIHRLSQELLKPGQQLVAAKYFNSPPRDDRSKLKRFNTYVSALQEMQVQVEFGRYQRGSIICSACGYQGDLACPKCLKQWPRYVEKLSDVKLAVEMVTDGFVNAFDTAILVSADADFTTPISKILTHDPSKRVVVAFPPKRHSAALKRVSSGYLSISRVTLVKCQLPSPLRTSSGALLHKPSEWK
jgi:uncharacterized LabA/DUF88 family protein